VIHVDDGYVTDAHEDEVLDDLVAEGAGSDHDHPRRFQALLIPPANQALPVVTIGLVIEFDRCAIRVGRRQLLSLR
jgi:hypothetical protein